MNRIAQPSRVAESASIGDGTMVWDLSQVRADGEPFGVTVHKGALVGARSVPVAPLPIGRCVTIAAGAAVTKDVPSFALIEGTSACSIGWVGKAGQPLKQDGDLGVCPAACDQHIDNN